MEVDRREFLAAIAGLPLAQSRQRTRLILLGTRGGPRVGKEGRRNSSVLLLINGVPYVVDCGYGTSQQLLAAGIPLNSVRYIFVTHHHSDHALEYGPLFYNGWVSGAPVRVDSYGPPGLEAMTRAFFEYMKIDIDTRMTDEGRPDPRTRLFAHDVVMGAAASPPIKVLENTDVKVTAVRVPHPMIKDALAYRFDAADRSIVISGDTAYCTALADLAKGADVLVHEVMHLAGVEALLKRVPNAARLREHLLVSHTTPEDVGRVAAGAGVKMLVLYHFVPADDPSLTDEMWLEGVRKHYKGRIVIGQDLMEL
jgi:ribonuclease BN (tRNA processing enzyme)